MGVGLLREGAGSLSLPKMPRRLPPFPRLIIRVGFRDQRLDLLRPGRKLSRQLRPLLRLLIRQVPRLPDILLQVVQLFMTIFKESDQLPVSVSNACARSASLIAVVGITRRCFSPYARNLKKGSGPDVISIRLHSISPERASCAKTRPDDMPGWRGSN